MRKADNLPPSCAVVTKFGDLNFLETSGSLRACNGIALPLPVHYGKGKGKFHAITGHENTALSFLWLRCQMGFHVQRHASAALPQGTNRYSLWAPGQIWTRVENLVSTGIRSPDRRQMKVSSIKMCKQINASFNCFKGSSNHRNSRLYDIQSTIASSKSDISCF